MTASSSAFDDFLQNISLRLGRVPQAATVFNEAARMGFEGNAPAMPTAGRMESFAQNLGKGTAGFAKGLGNPLTAGLLAGIPDFYEGNIAGGIGSSGGAAAGAAGVAKFLPAIAAIPKVGPALALMASVAAPVVGGKIGKSVAEGAANTGQTYASTLGQGSQQAAINATNPNALPNVTGKSTEDVIAVYKELSKVMGEERAAAFMQQNRLFDLANERERVKANVTAQMAPVQVAREQSLINAKGSIALADRVLSGGNDALVASIQNNPYAQMMLTMPA